MPSSKPVRKHRHTARRVLRIWSLQTVQLLFTQQRQPTSISPLSNVMRNVDAISIMHLRAPVKPRAYSTISQSKSHFSPVVSSSPRSPLSANPHRSQSRAAGRFFSYVSSRMARSPCSCARAITGTSYSSAKRTDQYASPWRCRQIIVPTMSLSRSATYSSPASSPFCACACTSGSSSRVHSRTVMCAPPFSRAACP